MQASNAEFTVNENLGILILVSSQKCLTSCGARQADGDETSRMSIALETTQ
jgi:hypothetical protein